MHTKYKHIPTGITYETDGVSGLIRTDTRDSALPMWLVENSSDWEKQVEYPLLITTDGVDKYKGDYIYSVNRSNWRIQKYQIIDADISPIQWFSSEEKAEEYVLLNKPCLSINDVATIYSTAATERPDKPNHQGNLIRNLVKSKL